MIGTARAVALLGSIAAILAIPAVAGAEVLYDQTDNSGPTTADAELPNFSPSNEFEMGAPDRTADDFTIPERDTWTIDGVYAPGAYSEAPQSKVNVFIYTDAAGQPGPELFGQTDIETPGPNYDVPLAGVPPLSAGHYWITVQQVADDGWWSWTTRTVQTGSPAAWLNQSDAGPCPPGWQVRSSCWPGNPDQVFRLSGSKVTAPPQNDFTFGKAKLNKKKGTATLPVTVPGPGELSVGGSQVAAQRSSSRATAKPVSGPGTVSVKIKPKGNKKKKLNRTGKVKVKAAITFTPTGGSANAETAKIKLKKTLR